jgi:uncharacterized protein YodC (DUF2158 family)
MRGRLTEAGATRIGYPERAGDTVTWHEEVVFMGARLARNVYSLGGTRLEPGDSERRRATVVRHMRTSQRYERRVLHAPAGGVSRGRRSMRVLGARGRVRRMKQGDIVKLVTGGPEMVVDRVLEPVLIGGANLPSEVEFICVWFEAGTAFKKTAFHRTSLQPANTGDTPC